MEKLKFALFLVVTLTLLGIFGYWAVTTIQSGTEYVTDQKVKQLEKENENLKIEATKLKSDINTLQSQLPKEPTTSIVEKKPEATVYKYQSLIDELQKLINDKILLKQKGSGSRVGTVQKFLNIYNNTSNKADNDYGAGTAKAVASFQKDSGLTADGVADSNTFSKMIDWLKKRG